MISKNRKIINKSDKKYFLINIVSIVFMFYIASTIIFRMKYIFISYILDAVIVGIFLLLIYMKKIKIYNLNKILIAYFIFAIFALASSFWAKDFIAAMFKSLQLFSIAINMYIIFNLIKNYNIEFYFIYGVLIGSFVNFIFALGISPSFVNTYVLSRFTGTVGNANALSVVMIISILVSIVYLILEKKKYHNLILYYYQYLNIILSLYLIVLTVSKKGIIFGFMLVLLFILISIKEFKSFIRLAIVTLIGFIVVVYFIDFNDILNIYSEIQDRFLLFEERLSTNARFGSTGWRLYFIKLGLELFQNNPIIGYGLNNFRLYSGGFYSHNNYIELLVGTGFIGTMIFYSIYVYIFQQILKIFNKDLKFILLFFLFILLGMDIATVSYYDKLILYTLLIVFLFSEKNTIYGKKKI